MERIKKIHPIIRKNVRYKLAQKIMEDNLINWLYLPQTKKLIEDVIKQCKSNLISQIVYIYLPLVISFAFIS